jgi:hypothetical protein
VFFTFVPPPALRIYRRRGGPAAPVRVRTFRSEEETHTMKQRREDVRLYRVNDFETNNVRNRRHNKRDTTRVYILRRISVYV